MEKDNVEFAAFFLFFLFFSSLLSNAQWIQRQKKFEGLRLVRRRMRSRMLTLARQF